MKSNQFQRNKLIKFLFSNLVDQEFLQSFQLKIIINLQKKINSLFILYVKQLYTLISSILTTETSLHYPSDSMIEIYQWDVIDMKMRQHLSKNQFQLYNKIKNTRKPSHQPQHTSNQKLSKNKPNQTNVPKFSFLDKKNQRVKQRPCLQLKSRQETEIRSVKKNQASISINQILAVRQYGFTNIDAIQYSKQTCKFQKDQNLHHQPFLNQLKLHKRVHSEGKLLKTQQSSKSTNQSDKSLTKRQRNRKYSVLSAYMTVTKVNFLDKNAHKCQSLGLSRKPSIAIPSDKKRISLGSPHVSDGQKKLEQSMEFKSLSSRPKTAEALCYERNQNLRNFLDLTGAHKKLLKL